MTRSQQKNAIILLQLLSLAVLLSWIVALSNQDKQQAQARTLLPAVQVQRIEIKRADRHLVFNRTEQGWQMSKPKQASANEQRVTPLLSLLQLPASHRYNRADIDPLLLGLEPATATVKLNQLVFSFGSTDSSGKKRYMMVNNSVYLVDDLVFPLISSHPDTFIAAK